MLQDKDFGKQQNLHQGHANPLAEVTTSLKTYQHFTLDKAYLGHDFFWAFTPRAGDFIRIRFFTPVRIERWERLEGRRWEVTEIKRCSSVYQVIQVRRLKDSL